MRVIRCLSLPCVLVLCACSDGTGPDDRPAELSIEIPAGTSVARSFGIAVRALDGNGGVSTRTNGTVTLSVSAGTISPATLEMQSGLAADSAAITGATGNVTVTARLAGRTVSSALRIAGSDDRLPGAATAPASTAIPDLVFETRGSDYGTTHPAMPGVPISFNTILLAPSSGAKVSDINALLDAVAAEIVGGLPGHPGGGGILMLRLPTTTHSALEESLAILRASPAVAAAAPDMLMSGDVLPPNGTAPLQGWTWERLPRGGNLMHELARVPQMWNLKDAITKAMGPAFRVDMGLVDDGFNSSHEDLLGVFGEEPVGAAEDHGTEIAGIIGASYGNGKGLDGVNPFASLFTSAAQQTTGRGDPIDVRLTSIGDLLRTRLHDFILERPNLRVINMSMGVNWSEFNIFPSQNAAARTLMDNQGTLFLTMLQGLQQSGVPLPVIVVSSGNASATAAGIQQARYNSPMTNAALRPNGAKNIIVTEAIALFEGNSEPVRFPSTDTGGHVSSNGFGVYTTLRTDYGFKDGTSVASPFVAGIVGYLYALDPSLPRPTLTTNPALDILLATAVPVAGAAPHVDAFAAAMQLDARTGVFAALRALVDVDDGTDDGNLRIDPVTQAVVTGDDEDADGGPGDGSIDMSDFRRLRDALLQVEGVTLDGSPTHPKKDLNGDGNIESAALEDLYPRLDFNGDGRLSRTATRIMSGVLNGQSLTDLQVLEHVFNDDDVTATALAGLLDSGDFHADGTACMAIADAVTVQTDVIPAGGGVTHSRVHPASSPIRVISAAAGAYTLRTRAFDASGGEVAVEERDTTVRAGEDILWQPSCSGLRINPRDVTMRVDSTRQFTTGSFEGAVTWSATGGTISSTGLYHAGTTPGTFRVKAVSVADPAVADSTSVVLIPGPFQGTWIGNVEFFGGFTGVTRLTLQLTQSGSGVTGTWSLESGFSGNWSGGVSGSTMTFNAVLVSPSSCSGSGSGTLVLQGSSMTGGGNGSGTCEGGRTFTFTIGGLTRQ